MVSFDSSLKNLSSNGSLFFFLADDLRKKKEKRGKKASPSLGERERREKRKNDAVMRRASVLRSDRT